VSTHPTHIAPVEALRGRSGCLALERLLIESFEPEEYLLFSAFDQAGRSLDQETCEKLFRCDAAVNPIDAADDASLRRLEAEATRHAEATIARSLEANNRYFQQERERLDKWADDMVLAAEKELADVKALIRAKERQARQAATTEEQHRLQSEIRELEKKKRRQRQRIFDVEDEIKEKRDELIAKLEARLSQRTTTQRLFAIRWSVA